MAELDKKNQDFFHLNIPGFYEMHIWELGDNNFS